MPYKVSIINIVSMIHHVRNYIFTAHRAKLADKVLYKIQVLWKKLKENKSLA